MSRDLGFSDRVFGLGAGIFFISYVALQIPGALLVEPGGHCLSEPLVYSGGPRQSDHNFMGAIPLSSVLGSPFAGWILSHKWLAVEGWRWLFFLEGMPAILLDAVAFFFLTDWPGEASWLAPTQRQCDD